MTSEAPPFWWEPVGIQARLLQPIAWAYGAIANRRLERAAPPKIDLPVLCVGNFTVGGSGKTPATIALASEAKKMGLIPGILTRGHGGSLSKPKLVDADRDSPRVTGDEPLVLAQHAPVAVGTDRAKGAAILKQTGCDFVIMDDGFQSRRLHFDYALMVVDALRGIGNGQVIPAGPLRAPLIGQLRGADAILVTGKGEGADDVVRMAAKAGKPIYFAQTETRNPKEISERRFLAFAGLGNPAKFFDTIVDNGGWLAGTREFPDHHPYTDIELKELMAEAEAMSANLVTTAKDAARLRHGSTAANRMLERLTILEIDLVFEAETSATSIIEEVTERFHRRSIL